jgi:toxin CcdB
MRRFDVVVRASTGKLVVIVQSDHLSELDTRLVVPLVPLGSGGDPASRLNPIFEIDGEPHIFVAQHAAALKTSQLGVIVGEIRAYRDEVTAALDLLITGF